MHFGIHFDEAYIALSVVLKPNPSQGCLNDFRDLALIRFVLKIAHDLLDGPYKVIPKTR